MQTPAALIALVLALLAVTVGVYVLRAWLSRRALHSRLRRGAWRLEVCPACRGSGRCRQCGGTGLLGLMGKPCPACRAGQESGSASTTEQGSGRCPQCLGAGRLYRDVASGQLFPISDA